MKWNYAWELWRDDRSLEMMERTIGYPSSTSVLLRFINIGLLCVQESPTDQPSMLSVVSMISNEHSPLPTPMQPTFKRGRNVMDTNSTINSVGNLTISIMEAQWILFHFHTSKKSIFVELMFLSYFYAYWDATY